MSKETGGQAICGKSGCTERAVRKQGHQDLCAKHYRFGQMRANAKRRGLSVPTHEHLHSLVGDDFRCPDCSRLMNWLSADGMASVASLQHYRDGTFGIVCRSCNTRHAFMPGDSFLSMPDSHKYCPSCKTSKSRDEFYSDLGRSGELKTKSYCKECSDLSIDSWRKNNREKYNEIQRNYRAKRKSEGNPVRRVR
ncbi:hypothetical protein [Serratia proteamaculans]|uniref:hypothetical protein n=1 Tax=Serratia proteamaculans TaxID=28151 RepID=UPI0021BDBCB3|nr:hypothetical protein [Serratia proteamaculans]